MKILITTARFLPHKGGLESVVYNIAQELIVKGHIVHIVTNRYPRTLPMQETIDGLSVTRFHFLLPDEKFLHQHRVDLYLASIFYCNWTTLKLKQLINDFQPDIINTHYLNETAVFIGKILSLRRKPIPWVISLHGGDVDGEPLMGNKYCARFKITVQQADRLTACSGFLAKQAIELDPSIARKIKVIHNGVNTEIFSKTEKHLPSSPYILAVGQLVWHKGFDLLIDAFAGIVDDFKEVSLVIAGDGEFHSTLEKQIKDKKLEQRISLIGRVSTVEVANLMANSLFIVVPSRREPFGIVALEGMAAGKIVLATPVGGIPEFLPVPPNVFVQPDEASWKDALNQTLSLVLGGQLEGSSNQGDSARFSWQNLAEAYMQVYLQAIEDFQNQN